jgi:phage shock protein PspC (stress-responsive transcriptional regulator)
MPRTTSASAPSAGAPSAGGTARGFPGLGLYRSPRHRLVGGVAGGIGERLGVDGVLVRAMFVVLTLAGGIGLLLCVAALMVPKDAIAVAECLAGAARSAPSSPARLYAALSIPAPSPLH